MGKKEQTLKVGNMDLYHDTVEFGTCSEACWWQHRLAGELLHGRNRGDWSGLRKGWMQPNLSRSVKNTQATVHLSARWPQLHSTDNAGGATRQVSEYPLNVAQPTLRLELYRTSVERPEDCSSSNLTELERIFQEEWEKLRKSRCAKL